MNFLQHLTQCLQLQSLIHTFTYFWFAQIQSPFPPSWLVHKIIQYDYAILYKSGLGYLTLHSQPAFDFLAKETLISYKLVLDHDNETI
jgi:hypothetical protein